MEKSVGLQENKIQEKPFNARKHLLKKTGSQSPICELLFGDQTFSTCPIILLRYNDSKCSTIKINTPAIMLAKEAANHIYLDCQTHYYKQMAGPCTTMQGRKD